MGDKLEERPIADFFPMGVVKIFAALDGVTVEEECQKLLNQEKEMRDKQ